jgi:UDP-N-acetylglucosamine:LPS N-acetylglucosamine transferase
MVKIEAVFFDAGGGHRAAAMSLQMVAESQSRPWQIELLNLQVLLDALDVVKRVTGLRIQDVYNNMLRSGWTLGSPQLMRILQLVIRLYHRETVKLLEGHWRETQPDMVISLVPHFNRALCQSFAHAFPGRPFVTILTDIADYPPHFWIERQKQFLICGSERVLEQARAMGHPGDRAFQTSGMICHPRFYEPRPWDRIEEREKLKLRPELLTGLVLFGGHGSSTMEEIATHLDQSNLELQLVMMCGRSEKLADKLRRRKSRLPHFVEGFPTRVPYYMHLADFFIGKPGPGSITEALVMNLPVIVERNAWTLPQERYNTQWVKEKRVGLVVRDFKTIVPAVARLLRPENLTQYKENAAALKNRAVFEIPDILEEILERS